MYKVNGIVNYFSYDKSFNRLDRDVITMTDDENCLVCKGNGTIELLDSQCPFCNGTGEFTKSAESYLQSHICQCIFLDRKMCPICAKKCHHDTPNRPKVLINPM
tara:strand:- start:16 stop:327 length:312 start_codon:yes stop_codon:yes gene_type:complete